MVEVVAVVILQEEAVGIVDGQVEALVVEAVDGLQAAKEEAIVPEEVLDTALEVVPDGLQAAKGEAIVVEEVVVGQETLGPALEVEDTEVAVVVLLLTFSYL